MNPFPVKRLYSPCTYIVHIWMSESGADIDISLRQPAFLHARYHETKKRQTPRIIVSEVLVGPRAKNSAMAAMGENAI